jgi:phage-related minor tail protein
MASLSSLNFRLTANIAPFRKGLNKAERAMDKMGRKMQQTGKNLSMKLTAPLAALGAVSFNVFKGFEAEMSKVKAVSGATAEEFEALSQNAKDLGASTMFTAREVAQLQTEFAKLGFTATEITKVTESTLALAQASGSDLARAAEVAGSTLRAFGLDASETGRVADVMAKSFSTSALDMEHFANSMSFVAPVAKSAGMSIEETSAMLAVLANAGIKGSKAGTALRRIISEIGATGKPVSEALKDLASKGLNLADAKDEVGRSAQSALLILSEGVDQIKPLTKEFENSAGAANAMATEMGDNALGASKRLESAMEGLGISIGEVVAEAVVPMIEKFAKLAGKLNKMSPAAKKTAVVFGAIVAAIGPLMFLTGGLIRNFTLLRAVMIKSTATTKMAAAVTRVFNVALKSNPIGVTIGLIASLTAAFVLFNKKKKEAVAMESKLSDSANENISNMQLEQREMNNLFNALKTGNLKSDQRRSIINKLNTEYTDYLPNLISEKSGIDDIALAQKEANKQFRKKIALVAFQDEITQATEKAVTAQKDLNTLTKAFNDQVAKGMDPRKIRFYQKDLEKLGVTSVSVGRNSKTLEGFQFSLNKIIGESQEEVAALEGNIESLGTSMEDGADGAGSQSEGIDKVGESAKKAKDPVAEYADELARVISLRDEYTDAESEIADRFEDTGDAADKFDDSYRKAYETAKMFATKYKELGEQIADVMHRTSIDTIAGMAEIAGAMVMGEASFADLGSFLLGQFAGLLAQLGKLFIQYGIGIEAFVKSLTLGPTPMAAALAVGAGVAMIAAAGAIRASISKAAGGDIPAMAEGGIVTGPTLALIGEGRESEAVIPLSKLNTMMEGGGGQNVVVTGRISGSDILLSNERASRNRTRQRGF